MISKERISCAGCCCSSCRRTLSSPPSRQRQSCSLCTRGGNSHCSSCEFSCNADNINEEFIKIFAEIGYEEFLTNPYRKVDHKGGRTAQEIQQPDGNEGFTILWNSEKQQHYLEAMNRILQNNDVSEEKWVKEASVFNRNLRQQLSVEDKEKPNEALNPDFQRKSPLCRAMLPFLQENILIAAIMMTAIFVMIVLVLLFSSYTRRKQALYSPTNMNYSHYPLKEKNWWQKCDDQNLRELTENLRIYCRIQGAANPEV